MKILYGVQATGNGHISRAHAMQTALREYPDVDITWLFSGRPKEQLAGVMDDFLWRRGMTFATSNGKVSYPRTVLTNNAFRLISDINSLDLSPFDRIIVDYEPVVAWAAKRRGRETIGIGHQYAFNYDVPRRGDNAVSLAVMKHFAPASRSFGLHWHHFGHPILPPIVDLDGHAREIPIPEKVVVYLPFEDQARVVSLMRRIASHEFFVYGPGLSHRDDGNVHERPLSRHGFKADLVSAGSVICNSGFELISECLSMGIRVLAKPLESQVEQLSNACALEHLGYAEVMDDLDPARIARWLETGEFLQVTYPAVHTRIARWFAREQGQVEDLAGELWRDVRIHRSQRPILPDCGDANRTPAVSSLRLP
ncbi:MAG: hypothetical protein KDI19_06540 [Pseudomonadales bacterium]|nr:hypothetical protein [Pseudomonadales bacterium]